MADFEIRVLGGVDIVVDGEAQRLPPQEARVLAILIASGRHPVRRETLLGWVLDDARGDSDRLSPVISRLRKKLGQAGLALSSAKESGEYLLRDITSGEPPEQVDAYRFEARVREGREAVAAGVYCRALECFRLAAADWRGTPFASAGRPLALPWVCDRYAEQLQRQRAELVRGAAQIALRSGDYEAAGFLDAGPVGDDQDPGDALWLMRFLTTLRDEGPVAAEAAIAWRRERTGYDDLVKRADDLLILHDHHFDVHHPLSPAPGRPPAGSPATTIGRRGEITAIGGLLDRVAGGAPAALALTGVAGVGKTRLVGEISRMAADRRLSTAVVTCRPVGDLQPWRVLAGTLWAHARRDVAGGPSPLSHAEERTLVDFVSAADDGSLARPGRERDPRQLGSLFRALLSQAARGGGLVVVIDDAHLLSPVALDLLRRVRADLAGVPLGFVLAGRPEMESATGLGREGAAPLALSPLDEDEVGQWLRAVWQRDPTLEELAEIYRDSGGMPLALCEVAESDGSLAVLPGPSTEAGAGGPLEWLAAAAITCVGQEIDTALVARVLGLDEAEADAMEVAAVASRAVELRDGVRFRHDAWREKVLADLARQPALSRRLHRGAFELLEEQAHAADWVDPALPVRVARHARAAGAEVPQERAARACLEAARAEQRGFGPAAAAAWAEEGLRLRSDPATRVGLLITLGDATNDAGDMNAAGRHYLSAYEAAGELPRFRAAAAIQLARRWSDPGQVDRQLAHVLRTSIEGLAGDDGDQAAALRLQLSAHLAQKATMSVSRDTVPPGDDRGSGADLARRTLAELTSAFAPSVRCEVLNHCRWALYDDAPPHELLVISERLHDDAIRAGSAYFRSESLVALAIDQLRVGRVNTAVATIEKHRGHIAQHPRPLGLWLQTTLDSLLDLWLGRFAAAEQRILGEALPVVEKLEADLAVPSDTLRQTWMGQFYWLRREQGRLEELFDTGVSDLVERHAFFPVWRAALVLACCETGRTDEAVDRLTALVADTDDLAALPPYGWTTATVAVLAESCALLVRAGVTGAGLAATTARLRELLAPHEDGIVMAGWPTVLVGPGARAGGLLALAAGEPEEASRLFGRAIRIAGAAPAQLARLRVDQAMALRARGADGDLVEAAGLLRRAQASAEELGMARLAQQARTLLTHDR
ncbi:AAA family ATPase [Microtetraspora sp. NBRC 13810]|uniref:AAA family ATPase n=1 Tax=Microtetraspora sp. NBRC 13810 TaxID=3030990 RepID=UPI0025562464|nr:AAA family ATPase [Microtetraspora sp. NBRC 13810]